MFDAIWGAGLDDAQMAAVNHTGGPLVIVAGADTGKTRTITARTARVLLTFTRRAAADMLSRAAVLYGERRASRLLWGGGTFHAMATGWSAIGICPLAVVKSRPRSSRRVSGPLGPIVLRPASRSPIVPTSRLFRLRRAWPCGTGVSGSGCRNNPRAWLARCGCAA
jgi:hypothetical protein